MALQAHNNSIKKSRAQINRQSATRVQRTNLILQLIQSAIKKNAWTMHHRVMIRVDAHPLLCCDLKQNGRRHRFKTLSYRAGR
ncbi:hypothetical protein [Synechococcus sp. CC9616]|uniref:hypothetical protein n=1 Tax=Synechococcus sp. CC9616 TaxID=110663 RepID=UPI0012ECA98C|nr:hypothetical protein [Synechococcus sp. CC9616]